MTHADRISEYAERQNAKRLAEIADLENKVKNLEKIIEGKDGVINSLTDTNYLLQSNLDQARRQIELLTALQNVA